MSDKIHLIYISAISVLFTLLWLSLNRSEKVEEVTKYVSDTLYLVKRDSFIEYVPKYIEKTKIDTLYLPTNNEPLFPLPIEQKHYQSVDNYDVWISGYEPQLDSIKTYSKVEYRTITNNITKEVLVNEWNLYPYIGFKSLNNEWMPSIGLMVKSPKTLMYGVEIGMYGEDVYWGVNVAYKLK